MNSMNERSLITSISSISDKVGELRTWYTVDSDDFRHLPNYQGHPTRSTNTCPHPENELSLEFLSGLEGFRNWMASHEYAVTLFLITDLLENKRFCELFQSLLEAFGERLTVGCHGHTHRSWSAWGEDVDGFASMLTSSTALLKDRAGASFRPYFRAPNGYIAPWMAQVLADHGYVVDSSVNPSWLTRHKTGGSSWKAVKGAMFDAAILERPWNTRFGLPVNGPALFRFPLSLIAKKAWKVRPKPLGLDEIDGVGDTRVALVTLYCHVLDFAKNGGAWRPPE